MSKTKATIAKSTYAYTGKSLTPTVTVKYGKTTLKKGTDYTVSYKNNKATGKATITVKGKGKYSGTVTKTFIIVPKKATVTSAKSAKTKTVTVTWKKDTQASGYQLVYSTNSKFKSSKSVNIAKNSTVKKTLTKLTKGKTYYVKVRSYKTIGGKKYYGAYSAVKKVKCK
jgi:fibronectin type 3 domain-containing protein